jgi:hypothetical protein
MAKVIIVKNWIKFIFGVLIGIPLCLVYGLIKGVIGYKPKR